MTAEVRYCRGCCWGSATQWELVAHRFTLKEPLKSDGGCVLRGWAVWFKYTAEGRLLLGENKLVRQNICYDDMHRYGQTWENFSKAMIRGNVGAGWRIDETCEEILMDYRGIS